MYDKNNVFAKILRGEIPVNKIYENEYAVSFHDANPSAEIHVLIIPRGEYVNAHDFGQRATAREKQGFWDACWQTAEKLGLSDNYNIITNVGTGPHGKQSVMHFHIHLFGGEKTKERIE